MTLEVIGIGMHRTGSLSVKVALERLGFGPAYHAFEFVGRRDHNPFWREAMEKDGDVDWERVFREYRAAFDWPMIYYWDKVIAAYPAAKVLLTERDPESWYQSHLQALHLLLHGIETGEVQSLPEGDEIVFGALSAKFSDKPFEKEHAIQIFEQHYQSVRETVSPERLLVYRPDDGWEPLCDFLGVSAPDEPFPRVNSLAVFTTNANKAVGRDHTFTHGVPWL